MAETVFQYTYPNGLVLLLERMEYVRSAAFNILVPAGCGYDPDGRAGLTCVLTYMLSRGAGERDNRRFNLALDELGVDRDESVGVHNIRFWASTLARNIPAVLRLYADLLLRPRLPQAELEPAKALAIQDILSLEDAPQSKVLVELFQHYYPPPLNKDSRGRLEDVRALQTDEIREQHQKLFRPNGTILSVAGNLDWEPLRDLVGELFADWLPRQVPELTPGPHAPASAHLPKDTHQTHIAFAFASAPVNHPLYYPARAAECVLSGGMSSRLFTEVREKRGLCYAVGLSYQALPRQGTLVGYAGTSADRAQQTLDVTLAELRRLRDGVTEDEIDRVKAALKSALIMQGESTSARSANIAGDWFFLGRVQSIDEIRAAIEALTPTAVLDYLDAFPIREVTVVTLGPQPLTLPNGSVPETPAADPKQPGDPRHDPRAD